MPDPLVPNTGRLDALTYVKNGYFAASLKLFQNNYTPVAGSVLGDFTAASFPGYNSAGIAYGTVAMHADGWAECVQNTASVFTRSSSGISQTVYGWYLTVSVSGTERVIAARRLDAPFTFTNSGDSYSVTTKLRLTDASVV